MKIFKKGLPDQLPDTAALVWVSGAYEIWDGSKWVGYVMKYSTRNWQLRGYRGGGKNPVVVYYKTKYRTLREAVKLLV